MWAEIIPQELVPKALCLFGGAGIQDKPLYKDEILYIETYIYMKYTLWGKLSFMKNYNIVVKSVLSHLLHFLNDNTWRCEILVRHLL